MIAVKAAQCTHGLVESAGSEVALVLEVNEEVENGPALEIRDRLVRIMPSELTHPAQVGLFGARAMPF